MPSKRCFGWAAATVSFGLLLARTSGAETVQAPAGGKAITLPGGRVACGAPAGDWTLESNPHLVRPPKDESAVGHVDAVKIAASPAECAKSEASLELVTTARLPAIDAASVVLAVDEGRLDVKGHGLRGVGVHWHAADHAGDDRCQQPEATGGVDRCSFAVGRGLSTDARAVDLSYFPAGGRPAAPDVATFDAQGRRLSIEELALRPARVVLTSLVPPNVSIDLAGASSRVPLAHADAVASVECGTATCALEDGVIVVRGVRADTSTIAVRAHLAPHVFFAKGEQLDAAPQFQVGVLPCAMSIASGEAIRGVDDTRAVVRLDARCAADARSLRFSTGSRAAEVLRVESDGGAAYAVVRVGRVEGDELAITATRGETDSSVVGVARVKTRAAPLPRASIEIEQSGPIDFIPTNRAALVRAASAGDHAHFVLLPIDGVYDALASPGGTEIRGVRGAAGFVAIHFGYRVDSLPAALASTDLAVIADAVERPLHEVSLPAPIGASATTDRPIVELLCDDGSGHAPRIEPGTPKHIPYASRDTCRLVFHRDRLAAEDGAQHLHLDIDVTRVDGEPRPDAHVSQTIGLRAGGEPRVAYVKGIKGPFDHVTIRLSHDLDESSFAARDDFRSGAPSVEWSVIAGQGHARLYATTAIPTGLYRVSDRDHSGILTLNFGVISRLTWLDEEGHGGFLGLEAGVMGVGLANDLSASGRSLTQVATVGGIGLSVPIANRSLATETSINLHAWAEYEISRDLGGEPGSSLGFVFGPSISIGNVGTNL